MTKPVILTGLRANNDLHIGNYFGALLPLVDMACKKSADYQVNLFVPDLHSFTTPIDHTLLHDQIFHNVRLFAAAGLPLDNPNIYIYRQSYISAHSELTWILDCFSGVGELSRMTQYKDKSSKLGNDRVSLGIFNYPVLMAADILLYNAVYIPVGDDQSQHLEFARDISERLNVRFGDLFVVPKTIKDQRTFFGKDQGLRIRDLQNPSKKMSKSDKSDKGIIFMGDKPDIAVKKIMSAATDSEASIHYNYIKQPGISNLLEIFALLTKQDITSIASQWEGKTFYGELKAAVAEQVHVFLTDFQAHLESVDTQQLMNKLQRDEATMRGVANQTLLRIQQAVGLRA